MNVYPREIIKESLSCNAAALILAHNHPSGLAEPSYSDKMITQKIIEAAELMDIRILDHFIVGKGTCYSLQNIICYSVREFDDFFIVHFHLKTEKSLLDLRN